ncbi:DUF2550 domain-containing protein [Nakamurella lactea]|uniref:DUF2550 domain-containing protein n=1 Tax=Nakamurella lactea TaxID=459515 RepID=UPI0004119EF2|nr:DUF2550 domain-containing protein [Nakamurella lactea]
MTPIEFVALGLLVAVVLVIALVAVRRTTLARSGGIDMSWRSDPRRSGGWVLGQGRFSGESLELFRAFSILPMASRSLDRHDLVLGERRPAQGTEPDLLPPESVIVRCRDAGADLELAMSEDALTGLRSWLESAPSGFRGPMLGR